MNKTLTLAAAIALKGQKITATYGGYRDQNGSITFIVGEIKSEYQIAAGQAIEGHTDRAAYWESYMSPAQLKEAKETLHILTHEGKETYIRLHNENRGEFEIKKDGVIVETVSDMFSCSDTDRIVSYTIAK